MAFRRRQSLRFERCFYRRPTCRFLRVCRRKFFLSPWTLDSALKQGRIRARHKSLPRGFVMNTAQTSRWTGGLPNEGSVAQSRLKINWQFNRTFHRRTAGFDGKSDGGVGRPEYAILTERAATNVQAVLPKHVLSNTLMKPPSSLMQQTVKKRK